jgi:phosphoglycerol geranylgeranyltransferase
VADLPPGKTESLLIQRRKAQGTLIAALIDPEDFTPKKAASVARRAQDIGVSLILIGGSTIANQQQLDDVVSQVKRNITIPVILFPGNITGISQHADAILFSSLLNSTNTYFIIGAQAIGAVQVKKYSLEAIPMGYLVFGEESSAGFVGQVRGIPNDKPGIAVMYALAAQYLGMRTLYLEAGSGSAEVVPPQTIAAVRERYEGLLIVGGGITDENRASEAAKAGADIIVIGNLLQAEDFEKKLSQIIKAVRLRS